MFKTIRDVLIGAFVAAAVSSAFAVIGTVPGSGPQLIDGLWANGLANGQNFSYQSGITAHAGGTQAACFSLASGIYLFEVDTVASASDSVCLPFAAAGTDLNIRNAATTNNLAVFAQSGTNAATATTDNINGNSNATTYVLSAGFSAECFVAKNGNWSCSTGH